MVDYTTPSFITLIYFDKSAKPTLPTLNNFKWNINICLQSVVLTSYKCIRVCQIKIAHLHFVGLDSFVYTQHLLKNDLFCVWGGGSILVKWKKIQIFGFQWRSHACEHVFSVCHKLKLSFIHVNMKLSKEKRPYKTVPEAQSVASPFRSRVR